MRVPYKWLCELVDVPWSPKDLADRLTLNGVAVETVEEYNGGLYGVVAGKIKSLSHHPSSDHLFVCGVDTGSREYQVVTGWDGVAQGQVVAFAPPGATLPGNWHIEEAAFAGVQSQGMLCALTEMLMGEPHLEGEGVLVLPDSVIPGVDLSEYFGLKDYVLTLDLTPNYSHCLSMVGVASEVAALTGSTIRTPKTPMVESDLLAADGVIIDIEAKDLCPRYAGKIVRGVKIGPSPLWLQARLLACGMRPISNIVDITNYVMLAVGQPLHAFDYERVRGRRIIVRRAGNDTAFTTLDGQRRILSSDALVIADAREPVAIAGVMGGVDSEVTAETKHILIESALFNPVSIRRTSTALGLRSEASLRFEKGVDPLGQIYAAELAASLMSAVAGGIVDKGVVDENYSGFTSREIIVRKAEIRKLLGLSIADEDIASSLLRLGFGVGDAPHDSLLVTVPSRRVDIVAEVDIIEEVGRIHGYEKIPATLLTGGAIGLKTAYQMAQSEALATMVGLGYEQVITFGFISPRDYERMRLGTAAQNNTLVLKNPMVEEQSVMRQSLVPGLLGILGYNLSRQNRDLGIFDMGKVFLPSGERLPNEPIYLTMVATGLMGGRSWEGPRTPADFFQAKGVLESFVHGLLGAATTVECTPGSHPSYHPWRQGNVTIVVEGERLQVGVVGEIHPDVARSYGIEARVSCFEIDLEPILSRYPVIRRQKPVPRYPGVSRDIALVVPDTISSTEVRSVLLELGGSLLESVDLFDLYRGSSVPEGSRSLAFSMVYRSIDKTLTDREVDDLHEEVRREATKRLGAMIR